MKVRLMQAHYKVEETRNQVAVMRGPIVYCLESVDLPENVHVSEILIPSDMHLTPLFEPNFLGGVTILQGKALRITRKDDRLYSELSESKPEPVSIKLIPYYAWSNRGVSEMTVWMPIAYR